MNKVIIILLSYIQLQQRIIIYLIGSLIGKHITQKIYDEPINKPYRKLQVDKLPIIETLEKLDFKQLLIDYETTKGKPLKPVKPHKNSNARVPNTLTCPKCGAPHNYLYDNTGGRGQFKCKVCGCLFNFKNYYSKAAILKCPYCSRLLTKKKERKDFHIFKCINDHCSLYLHNLATMSKSDKECFKVAPHEFKVRYIHRQFNFDFKPLSKTSPVVSNVDLSRIYAPTHTLSLILTYHVNFGLSFYTTLQASKLSSSSHLVALIWASR